MSYKPLSAPFVTDFPEEWYDHNLHNHFWFSWRLRVLQRLITTSALDLRANLRGLEIGCGVAFFRSQVESITSWTIDAADLNEAALKRAVPGRGDTLLYNIEEKKPELKEYFDVLFLFDVLEHIEKPGAFLDAALWHLKAGGAVIINVPALTALYSRYDELVGHYRRYQIPSMRDLLKSSSSELDVKDMRYWGFSLIPIAGARKMALRKSRTPQQAITKGFELSAGWINHLFLGMMRLETALVDYPPLGTSLMALAIKK